MLSGGRGTCITKHALLAVLAREQDLDIDLVLAIFEMNEANTPGVGAVLSEHGLASLPEAHCFLRWQDTRIDVIMPTGSRLPEQKQFVYEEIIEPDGIGDHKVAVHRPFLARWHAQLGHDDLDLSGYGGYEKPASRRFPQTTNKAGPAYELSGIGGRDSRIDFEI